MTEQPDAAELPDDPTDGLKRFVTRIIPSRPPKLAPRPSVLDGADPGPVPTEPAEFAVALAAAQFLVAEHIASNERDEKRREKMDRVVQIQRETLNVLGNPKGPATDPGTAVGSMTAADAETRITFLIEVFFLDPFSPYSLRYSGKIRRRSACPTLDASRHGDPQGRRGRRGGPGAAGVLRRARRAFAGKP